MKHKGGRPLGSGDHDKLRTLRLPSRVDKQVVLVAERESVSVSEYMRQIITERLRNEQLLDREG